MKTKNDMGWAGMTGGDTGDAAAQLADQLDGGGLNMADTSIELGSAYVEESLESYVIFSVKFYLDR